MRSINLSLCTAALLLSQAVGAAKNDPTQIALPSTTLIDALFRIGKTSNQCIGAVFVQKASAQANTPAIQAKDIGVRDLLIKLLTNNKQITVHRQGACMVIGPVRDYPAYLHTVIASFRAPRDSLDFNSYRLAQILLATESKFIRAPAGGGVVGSIGGNTDSPEIGPLQEAHKTVEALLCNLASRANSAMWIALPKKPGAVQHWRFILYSERPEVVRAKLRGIVAELEVR